MEAKKSIEVGQDVYFVRLDRNENELYYITAKVVDVTYGDETMYVCRAYADSTLYTVSEKDVFATYQEAEERCKNYTIAKIKTEMPKVNLSDIEKLKIAYEVIRDLETRDDIKGLRNSVTSVKNLIANDIAFAYTFGEK
jgi:hypothetical protein